jgi:outer membrane receptor protein involved in Fe transport
MTARYAFRLFLLACSTLAASPSVAQQSAGETLDLEGTARTGNEIVVTAQKFEQRAQDVPITVSALSDERIEELGVTDLDELSNYVPGLNIQEQSANNPGIVIRGITSDSGSAQQGPRVTLYYNGVDISRSRGSYQAIYDLERVEVIKGPQATLFGTASAVGAISIISARPREGYSAEVSAGLGNFESRLLSGFVNAGTDVLAARIAFEWRKRDGYIENLAPSQQEELYAQDNLGVRGSLRIVPTDALTIDLIGTFDRQRNGGTPFISRTFPTAAGPANVFGPAALGGSPVSAAVLGDDQLGLNREIYDLNLAAEYSLSDEWTFTTVNGLREFDSIEIFDADGSAAWFLEFAEIADGRQFSHEGRFSYAGTMFRGSAGWNYFTEEGRQNVPFSSEEGTFLQCLRQFVGNLPCIASDGTVSSSRATALATGGVLTQAPYSSTFENQGQNDSYSLFADGTWIASDVLELTAGVRLLWEERQSGYWAIVPAPVLPNLVPTGPRTPSLVPGQVDTGGQTFTAEDNFFAVLPRFNALYRIAPDVNVFATVSKGRRSPVVQLGAARDMGGNPVPNLQLVPEETVWNYEGGVKVSTGIVSGSLGVFYQKYDGFQVSVVQPDGTSRTESAGTASNFGVEAEVNVRPTPWLSLFGNVGYIDGGIDENNTFAPTFSGARFRLQPEWQAAAGFTIDAPIGNGMRVFATPSLTYRSRIFFELPNSPLISQEQVTLLNVRAGVSFADERFELSGFIRNATDEQYLLDAGNTGGGFGLPTFIPAEPRFYGIELTARAF